MDMMARCSLAHKQHCAAVLVTGSKDSPRHSEDMNQVHGPSRDHQEIKDKDSTGDKAVAKVQDPSRRQDQRHGWGQAHPQHSWGQDWMPRPELKWSPQAVVGLEAPGKGH